MAEQLKRDQNHVTVQGAVTDDVNQTVEPWRADATTKRLLVAAVVAGSENGKILVDAADTTYDYIATKLVAGSGITLTVLNPGGNETLEIASAAASYYSTVQDNGVSVTQRPRLNFVDYFTVTDNPGNTSSDVNINITQLETALDLANIGGFLDLSTQVTGLLSSTNIDISNLESALDLGNIAGQIDLSTQVTGQLDAANIDQASLDLAMIGGLLDWTQIDQASVSVDLTNQVTGVLPLANGGTGSNLSDPGANKLWGWDDTDNSIGFWTIGSGLSYDHSTHTLSSSGGSVIVGEQNLGNGDRATGADDWVLTSVISNADGSVVYGMWYEGANTNDSSIARYEKDTVTGMYYLTHFVLGSGFVGQASSIALAGSFLYQSGTDGSGDLDVVRFDASDLTGQTNMTGDQQPTTTGEGIMFSDGTDLYISLADGVYTRYTISGTALTNTGSTITGGLTGATFAMQIGSDVFMSNGSVVNKYTYTTSFSLVATRTYTALSLGSGSGTSVSVVKGAAYVSSTVLYVAYNQDFPQGANVSGNIILKAFGQPV